MLRFLAVSVLHHTSSLGLERFLYVVSALGYSDVGLVVHIFSCRTVAAFSVCIVHCLLGEAKGKRFLGHPLFGDGCFLLDVSNRRLPPSTHPLLSMVRYLSALSDSVRPPFPHAYLLDAPFSTTPPI